MLQWGYDSVNERTIQADVKILIYNERVVYEVK